MEALFSEQQKIGKDIEHLIKAYHSEIPERKTLQYLQENLAKLQSLWVQFDKNDSEMRKKTDGTIAQTHSYFARDYYSAVEKGYEEIRKEILCLISYLDTSKGATRKVKAPGKSDELSIQNEQSDIQKVSKNTSNRNETSIIRLVRRQKSIIAALEHILRGITISEDQPVQYYEVKIETIRHYWEQIEASNLEIWETADDSTEYGYDPKNYFDLQGRTQEILVQLNQELGQKTNIASTSHNTTPQENNTGGYTSMKLPKIVLPKFDGDYLKWNQFFDLFSQMVHNQQMGNSQKMWYLKMNLTGEAEKLIRHLPLTDDSYPIAWDILKGRYENKRLLVTALLDKLMAQPPIMTESAAELKALHDNTKECLLSLQNLGLAVKEHWDPIIIHILMKKLDKNTHALFEQSLTAPRDLQSVEKLLKFVETRFQALEALGQKSKPSKVMKAIKPSVLITNKNNNLRCPICNKSHAIYYCDTFLKMSANDRNNKAKELNLCLNCLKKGHNSNKCGSRGCQKCNKKHNTLLHIQQILNQEHKSSSGEAHNKPSVPTNLAAQGQSNDCNGYVFLGTAVADAISTEGELASCRILLDSGSQLNFITERLRKKLKLAENRVNLNVAGIGDARLRLSNRLNVTIKSKLNDYTTQLEAFVIKEITAEQPHRYINIDNWNIPENLTLADPEFNKPQRIDILLGAEMYGEIMRNGQIKLNEGLPMLQNTTLGWIVLGKVVNSNYNKPFCGITNVELEEKLQRFWEIEECPSRPMLSATDQKCEEYFDATTTRNEEGRFIVNLPMLSDPKLLGESKDLAFKRLLSIERKLLKDPNLKKQYDEFLDEYLHLGHMKEIKAREITPPYYFFPHHCVLKPTSNTTKLRVVFDGSAKTSNNLSLNDLLLNGPKLQDDIISIILRFRMRRYVFTTDIVKMYRQILVAEEDRNLQLIMWRKTPDGPVKYYQLCTVTYGTRSAPYLAIKCLQRLAEEEKQHYPLGAAAIKDCYVDDILTGSDNLEEAIIIQTQLRSLLKEGGFELKKWCANHPRLIENIPQEDLEIQLDFSAIEGEHVRTLGLVWQPITDSFVITTELKNYKGITKRTILAELSGIFDPLGLINPVVVMGKIFMQNLWKLKLDWDDEIPVELYSKWLQFREEICKLKEIEIPRFMFSNEATRNIELHAFSDASEKAYGAVLYLRSVDRTGRKTVRLLCAKSRVAPVKPVTLPRLELCAAKLSAQLVNHVKEVIKLNLDDVYYWTDSKIVIAWVQGDSSLLKTFVANRVAAIQELSDKYKWRYVNTKDNPADLVSRGMFPEQLKSSKLWFDGPEFLSMSKSSWPQETIKDVKLEEEEKPLKISLMAATDKQDHPLYAIEHGNSFRKLQRTMAYLLRSAKLFKREIDQERVTPLLTVSELNDALVVIFKEVQRRSFHEELRCLQRNKEIPRSNKLTTLAPFIDSQGLLRVGGRLEKANIDFDAKHPILLPSDSFVTKLLLNHLHSLHLHAGPQALHAIARQKYWILQGRNLTRSVVTNCVRCTKIRPRLCTQQMGNLPSSRVQRARPFLNTGVDFCGPFYTHFKIRGKRPQKSYLAVFCCFATKAIHLEVVSDLTTEGFIGALRRLIARRGRCENIYCDNAKNFVGANNRLTELYEIMTGDKSREKIVNMCADHKIQFHFNPPRSPHFGGLWEAAVKSTKQLLARTVASAALTYEELCTIAAEIEAILNSRPLTPSSSDPNDFTALTPGHFLIGEPITSTIDTPNDKSKMSLHARWALVDYLRNEFWRRWTCEYLTELQKRCRWTEQRPNIKVGTMVMVKDENLPPLKWSLGRVIEAIQGHDGKVRVVDVQTTSGIFRRAIHQLAPLPIESDEECNDTRPCPVSDNPIISEPDRKEMNRGKKRRNSSTTMNALKVFLLTSLVLPLVTHGASPPIQVQELKSRSGIFLENMGKSNVICSHWNLLVYYDLRGYWATVSTIEESIKHLKRLCNNLSNNDYYVEIVEQYWHQLEEIHQYNIFLTQDNIISTPRRKRSPLDVVGTIANKLFGILDNEYASKMADIISKIKGNEDHLYYLLKNQTSILETTNNIVKRNEEDRLKQIAEIEKGLEAIYDKVSNMTSELKQQRIIQAFNTLAIFAAILISECKFMQKAILDVLADTHHGRANPLIISPEQLQEQLVIIKDNLPTEVKLPSTNNLLSLSLIYKLMNVQCTIHGHHVLFLVNIPLSLATTFELYRLVPFPTLVNSTLVSIIPEAEFIMTNLHRDQFYQMTDMEFTQCAKIAETHYMCPQKRPIHYLPAVSSNCEMQLLLNQVLPATCTVKSSLLHKVWIQLYSPNQWLFSLDRRYDFLFVCNTERYQKTLEGNGLLSLQGDCIMKDDGITIRSTHTMNSQIRTNSFQPAFNITFTDISLKNDTALPEKVHLNQRNHTIEFDNIQKTLNDLKSHQTNLQSLQPHDIHQFAIGYIALGSIIAIGIFGAIKYIRTRITRKKVPPQPAPRKRMPDENEFRFEVGNFKVAQDV